MNDLHGMDGSIPSSSPSPSPVSGVGEDELKHFSEAKLDIDKIFSEVTQYINNYVRPFIDKENDHPTSSSSLPGFNTDAWMQLTAKKSGKIQMLSERVARNYMKVVFFGRTSNGKSTSINAILQDKVLPAGLGHTTSCFIQVQKSETGESYISSEDKSNKGQVHYTDIRSVSDLADETHAEHLTSDSLVTIHWSPQRCPILKHEVKILDSPGIDVNNDIDSWISRYCLDADVFILVNNAESTMMQTEKLFFHRVANIISKPNIFILNNRWDMAAELEPEVRRKVQEQHKDRCVEFLVKELNCCDMEEALDRVFFISAKEALNYRIQKHKIAASGEAQASYGFQIPGAQERLASFHLFERQFSHCLSHTAVKTRFSEPAKSVARITEEFSASFNRILELCSDQSKTSKRYLAEWTRRNALVENCVDELITETSKKIDLIVQFTQNFVIAAMNEECKRIQLIVNGYRAYFDDKDANAMEEYKKNLYKHVRQQLRANITTKCSGNLQRQITEVEDKMKHGLQEVQNIFDTGAAGKSKNGPPTVEQSLFSDAFEESDFSSKLVVDAPSIGTDFQEDLTFQFTLGLSRILAKIAESRNPNIRMFGTALAPMKDISDIVPTDRESAMMAATKIFINGTPQITTALTIGYGAYKVMGWKMLAGLAGCYVSIYAWERAMWNSRAKERLLKKQFSNHASLHIIRRKNDTAEEASSQLDHSLKHRQDLLQRTLRSTQDKIQNEICLVETQLRDVERIQNQSKILRNKADWISRSVTDFASKYFSTTVWNADLSRQDSDISASEI